MSATFFNALAYVKKLRAAGVPEPQAEAQAEALVEVIDENLATKKDIFEIKKDLKESELRFVQKIEELEFKIKEIELRMTIRLGGLIALSTGILATLIKLL